MGVDLVANGRYLAWNWHTWERALSLAMAHGWVPEGTQDPCAVRLRPGESSYDEWRGSYFLNEGQLVTDRDARALAHALEQALPALPDRDLLEGKWTYAKTPKGGTVKGLPADVEVSPTEWFSGDGKADLGEFIAFCWRGGFRIW